MVKSNLVPLVTTACISKVFFSSIHPKIKSFSQAKKSLSDIESSSVNDVQSPIISKRGVPKLPNIIDDDDVRVKIDHSVNAGLEYVSQVVPHCRGDDDEAEGIFCFCRERERERELGVDDNLKIGQGLLSCTSAEKECWIFIMTRVTHRNKAATSPADTWQERIWIVVRLQTVTAYQNKKKLPCQNFKLLTHRILRLGTAALPSLLRNLRYSSGALKKFIPNLKSAEVLGTSNFGGRWKIIALVFLLS
ncbi:hypothetical protein NE237_014073 [Protea cynaroides]|uniref:Uncharacterized protein n=1 Tax=Protea cynaroides TaxID=273540 RepID=A0A9Q0K0D3_9MAGN|nr:hypothetical protein NE237_014073 [Protea cynaroides]